MMSRQALEPERVDVSHDHRQDLVGPTSYMALTHAQLHATIEHLHHRERVELAAVDATYGDGAAAPNSLQRRAQRMKPVDANLSTNGSAPRPPVSSMMASATLSTWLMSTVSMP